MKSCRKERWSIKEQNQMLYDVYSVVVFALDRFKPFGTNTRGSKAPQRGLDWDWKELHCNILSEFAV